MRSLIVTSFKLLLVFFLSMAALSCFAGDGSARPFRMSTLTRLQIQKLNSGLATEISFTAAPNVNVNGTSGQKPSVAAGRICSCQVLNLESSNYEHRNVVLLAEKTNDGSSESYSAARNRIQKEKKHLKKMFYDKVKVVAELQGTGSCKSMFYQLRTADKNLQLYEILNADINP